MKFKIESRWDASLLFECDADSIKIAVELAVKSKANLYGANLVRANLDGANLDGANLDGANLVRANLVGAKHVKDHMSIGRIGSRNDRLTATITVKGKIVVCCGCWKGTLEGFVKRVKEVHIDNEHAKAYLAAVDLIKIRFGLTE